MSNGKIASSTVIDSQITANNPDSVGGIAGMISLNGSTTTTLTNCDVTRTKVTTSTGFTGGIAGFANNTISGCNVTDSEVKTTSNTASGTGGILGHGANTTGMDVTITNSNVIDTKITGNNQVGGISGGAVAKIQNCFVGGKNGESFETGTYAVEIKGNSCVGGIIGDAGVITNDLQVMITLQGNTVENSLIEGKQNVDPIIGKRNSFGTITVEGVEQTYEGTQVEVISKNVATDCVVNVIQ